MCHIDPIPGHNLICISENINFLKSNYNTISIPNFCTGPTQVTLKQYLLTDMTLCGRQQGERD